VVRATLPTARERCGKMGTLGKDGSNPLIFDGKPESLWSTFKKALYQFLDKEGYEGEGLGVTARGRDVRGARSSRVGIKFIDPMNHTYGVELPKYQNTSYREP